MTTERVDGRTLRFQHRRPELLDAATEYVLDHGIANLSLQKARDQLLPKLMSGQLDVSGIRLPEEATA